MAADVARPAIGRDDVGAEQAVEGEAVLAGERADTATLGEPCDAHCGAGAPGDRHGSLREEGVVHMQQVCPRADARPGAPRVHLHVAQGGEVDDEARSGREPLKRVAPRPRDGLHTGITAEVHGALHVGHR
jgi:hypothetical protein